MGGRQQGREKESKGRNDYKRTDERMDERTKLGDLVRRVKRGLTGTRTSNTSSPGSCRYLMVDCVGVTMKMMVVKRENREGNNGGGAGGGGSTGKLAMGMNTTYTCICIDRTAAKMMWWSF